MSMESLSGRSKRVSPRTAMTVPSATAPTALLCDEFDCPRRTGCALARVDVEEVLSIRRRLGKPQPTPGHNWRTRSDILSIALRHAIALALVGVASVTGLWIIRITDVGSVALIYLLPVVITAIAFGLDASMTAAVSAIVAYDLLFLSPLLSFGVNALGDAVRLFVLLAFALLTSKLVSDLKAKSKVARAQARENAVLARFARKLNSFTDASQVAEAVAGQIMGCLGVEVAVLIPRHNEATLIVGAPTAARLSEPNLSAVAQYIEECGRAGEKTVNFLKRDWLFFPLRTRDFTFGVVGLGPTQVGQLQVSGRCIAGAICNLATVALERLQLTQEQKRMAEIEARDRARSVLLASIGHDLRTPLSSVLGYIFELRRRGLDDVSAHSLLENLEEEAIGVSRLITNLLEMSRLEAGSMPVKIEPVDLVDAVAEARYRSRRQLRTRDVLWKVSPDLPLAQLDPVLLHHCLINLLDNATKHGDAGSAITIFTERREQGVLVGVSNYGPELRPDTAIRLTELFSAPGAGDRRPMGAGLGLLIVKGFADVMGLEVAAASRCDGESGCTFTLHIPNRLLVLAIDSEMLE
ncbi:MULTISPECIES: DUF4118 domain-containing protein [unclassified Beijerinckia]|uniref:DUF4118 domain-containing protein n=1 Tax=unclassified Beijerinckia TaxID=2638183 RepID=UPI00089A6C70|nr:MULTISPECIES: DUF4118 domain-containing protein [unclassified Beijerinckia]MDH7797542.1 K+-sensing histidine kinase KdpD [Beijerinckia sp. GAS462]SEC89796.1 two-component system, OmpR family, sensor histidine kinase KdpD [Beijerinckia sp. 28-YEA-48]